MKAQIELTDTFCGEANYSWVERHEFETDGLTEKEIIRKARKLIGLTGSATVKTDLGDVIQWNIKGACLIAFLWFDWCE
mgnify:CR=1 FL=1|tara:strand:+ start:1275 stop:1511 length:237 start_codon:yes stop_codon:yes gene_type:complete